jgi:hypothetical protein
MDLPNFEKLFELAETIANLTREVGLLDIEIKFDETKIVKTVSTDEKYVKNGKAPATNYIEATYKYAGYDGELIPKRRELAIKESELKKNELAFQVLKMQIDVYRTESANARLT